MQVEIQLTPQEVAKDYPFTALQGTQNDLKCLKHTVFILKQSLTHLAQYDQGDYPLRLEGLEPGGLQHRITIFNPELLSTLPLIHVVGFGSKTRKSASQALALKVFRADERVIEALSKNPNALSYSCLELADGSWRNLVLMANTALKDAVNECEEHTQAIRDLAPKYYEWVRIHNLTLTNFLEDGELNLLRTKYFFYSEDDCWRAIREYPATSLGAEAPLPQI